MSEGNARPSRPEKRGLTRQRLLDAAEEVFAQRGYDAASVEEVARRAGFTIGALYSNFHSKKGLFLAVLDRYLARDLARLRELTEQVDPQEWLTVLARYAEDPSSERGTSVLLSTELWLHAQRNPRARASLAEAERRRLDGVRELVAERVPGLAEDTVEKLSYALAALCTGFTQQRMIVADEGSPGFAELAQLLFTGVLRKP